MDYLNQKMPYNTISQCKMEMKSFSYVPKFETMETTKKVEEPKVSDNYMQSRRESRPSRNNHQASRHSSK